MSVNQFGIPYDFRYVPEKKTKTVPINLSHVGIELSGAPEIVSERLDSNISGLKKSIFEILMKKNISSSKTGDVLLGQHPIREKGEIPMGI